MGRGDASSLLREQRDAIELLKPLNASDPKFKRWKRDCDMIVSRIFGSNCDHLKTLNGIVYGLSIFSDRTPKHKFHAAYVKGLDVAAEYLDSFIVEIERFGPNEPTIDGDAERLVENLCRRFAAVVRQLTQRHGGRRGWDINDEYDVQDLLHGLLRIHFDDIRSEDAVPSHAGSNSRVDFFLKAEGIVIEAKMMRESLSSGKLGEQLLVDVARYRTRPDVKALFFLIYDPNKQIRNPVGLLDVEKETDRIKVRVIVVC